MLTCGNAWVGEVAEAWLGDVILRSTDDGRTWGDTTVLPFGCCESNILELPSGTLLCATRYDRNMLTPDFFKVNAGDDSERTQAPGRAALAATWDPPSTSDVSPGRYKNEAVMLSHDRGRNWTIPTLVTRLFEVSGDLALLPDGRVVLTYDQKLGVRGPRALVSNDGGLTWEPDIYVLCWGHGGRTSSIALPDGRVLTLTAGGWEEGTRATIWSPE